MAEGVPQAPVALFAFNRPDMLSRTLGNLVRCEGLDRDFYVFIDGPRDGREEPDRHEIEGSLRVLDDFKRRYAPQMDIQRRDGNWGLKRNIIDGVASVLQRHGRVIVMEDDFLVGRYFLRYMDEALEQYKEDERIWCVNSGRSRYVNVPRSYPHDVYLSLRNVCGTWGVWADRWGAVDFSVSDWPEARKETRIVERVDAAGVDVKWMLDAQCRGEINSWAVACTYHMARHGLYAVEPRLALSKHIGWRGDGTNCRNDDVAGSRAKYYDFLPKLTARLEPDDRIVSQIRYMVTCPLLATRIKRKLLRLLWRIGPRHDEPKNVVRW